MWSKTIRSARTRSSSGYLPPLPTPDMTPSSQGSEPPRIPGRFRSSATSVSHMLRPSPWSGRVIGPVVPAQRVEVGSRAIQTWSDGTAARVVRSCHGSTDSEEDLAQPGGGARDDLLHTGRTTGVRGDRHLVAPCRLLPVSQRGDGRRVGRRRDRYVLQLPSRPRAPGDGERLGDGGAGHRHGRPSRRRRHVAAPSVRVRAARIGRTRSRRRSVTPSRARRLRAPGGSPVVRRTRVVAVARRGTPRGLARPDVAARVPRRRTCRRA